MKMALLVIDLQKAYENDTTRESMRNACEYGQFKSEVRQRLQRRLPEESGSLVTSWDDY